METNTRLIIKAVTWQALGFVSMTVIGAMFTGSFGAGSGIALSGAILGFVSYLLHEKLWSRIGWGRD